ncbi:heterokaryon incompatibility protein-domain-containing protein [Ilyonectria sp. MPI-CAGE-AT-0026]|nr:heterokaryon incompatibility protein-domain-containing protein [Ilyonectria sp. MPI-CAGE-AT-0026]
MALNTTYKHTPITAPRTIRLMHVYPGSESDAVQISLITTALDAAPDFESISYCWGDAQDQHQLTCNGATLSITNSLFTGLVRFRHAHQPRVLWADAVCINQADPVEKNKQVMLMPHIYSQATHVLIWLGIADDPVYGYVAPTVADSIRQALELLPDFDPENAADRAAKSQAVRRDSHRLQQEGKPNVLDHDWMPLVALLARPWFCRKWVVQEVSLARHAVVYVGDQVEIPWPELARLAFNMEGLGADEFALSQLNKRSLEGGNSEQQESQERIASDDKNEVQRRKRKHLVDAIYVSVHCITAINMIQVYRLSGTLLDGVIATMFFQCTDPRDYVYSLLSLGAVGPTVQPDYEASVSDVFRQFAIAMLLEGQSLKLLSLAPDRSLFSGPDSQRIEGLPSWVPDLRLVKTDVFISYTVRPQAFSAGGYAKPILSVSEDQRLLSCKGVVIDTVNAVSASLFEMMLADMPELRFSSKTVSDPIPKRRKMRFARWLEGCYCVAFGSNYDVHELAARDVDATVRFSRTMMCDMDAMRNRLSPKMIGTFPRYMKWAIDRAANHDGKDSEILPSALATTYESIGRLTTTTKFCVTKNGRFGLLPPTSQPGDSICVLLGGEVPFVIRPTGSGTYNLVGECYIDGAMDGEALEAVASVESLETICVE